MHKYILTLFFASLLFVGCKDNIQAPEQTDFNLQKQVVYTTQLIPENELHIVNSDASGVAIFRVDYKNEVIYYKIIVKNITGVTASHIHIAPPSENGPVGVFLLLQPSGEDFSGVLAEGVFTVSNFIGPLAGGSFEDLITHIENNNAYVNVHTAEYPAGEIRGNF